jgi:PIN domain nuclease of toxin-antitoxin system
MRFLLDTHTLLWCVSDSRSLSPRARKLIEDGNNEILVSAASGWEIAAKVRLGKLPTGEELVSELDGCLAQPGCDALPISLDHAVRAGGLPGEHRDPFDRVLMPKRR